ncbi:hypothetical protein FOL47_006398 [Perkinsus chesapeaki]|uniref:J domain-containing protein n=1 Tax=Perkinsus chesapeaki TaxID=330153 RepID=A0A7J6LS39_PERCH|nr:hypothetical protein FOL47_006398 [Perkinsus chesapeaki]
MMLYRSPALLPLSHPWTTGWWRLISTHQTGPNYYEVLGVRKTATRLEINMAYKRLAKRYHPDMTGGDSSLTEKFREVTRAYNVLHNPTSRREYDMKQHQQQGPAHGYHRPGGGHHTYQHRREDREEETMEEKKARWMREARPMSGFQIFTLWAFIFAVPFFATFSIRGHQLRSLHRRAHPHDPDYWNGMPSDGYGMGPPPPSSLPTDPAARKDLVRAFWNPITERWEWLGEGFDAPTAGELLKWINSLQPDYFQTKLREGKAVMPLRASTEIQVGYIPFECTDIPPIVRTRPNGSIPGTGHCEKWDGAKQQAYDLETQQARQICAYYRQQALNYQRQYAGRYGGQPQGGPPQWGPTAAGRHGGRGDMPQQQPGYHHHGEVHGQASPPAVVF